MTINEMILGTMYLLRPQNFRLMGLEILLTLHKKMKFSIKYFFSKCDQVRRKLRIWSHLLKKSSTENFIFYAMSG